MLKRLRIPILIIVLLVVWIGASNWVYEQRIAASVYALHAARQSVKWYEAETGSYPDSIRDVSCYAKEHKVDYYEPGVSAGELRLFLPDFHFERISSRKGSNSEHASLTGQGGFYYNKETGEVRINLTKPLREYFLFCCGHWGSVVPAKW
ncbi:MAG: hypothetical protein IH624_09860 [Phycisphaerae bacterium]|nr:hypothetical protein [Phycisphaerae bacterium]